MKVALVQTHLFWENRKKNLEHFSALLKNIKGADLIILPEMFTSGFSMNTETVAERSGAETLDWLKNEARKKKAVICGSTAVKQGKFNYNRLFWVQPEGTVKSYDKRHLFRMGKEDEHYKAGKKKLLVQYKGWKFCPLICYDLRFPVWSRNKFRFKKPAPGTKPSPSGSWDYDVLIYVANWPDVRAYPWKQLLIARAIENQCYVIGVNRVGKDGNGIDHAGISLCISPKGEIIHEATAHKQSVALIDLDKGSLEKFRHVFPAGLDADAFSINF
ncbi:MAG TPA: nitrilase family protein [Bacteroidia bacterium]|nr:nitrilase family protein [Bacteroidia bacterium]